MASRIYLKNNFRKQVSGWSLENIFENESPQK